MNKKSYSRYRKSRRWRTKRRTIMKRAGCRCRKCGRRETQGHHETYRRVGRERLSDLTAVCGGCHKRIHG